MSQADVIQLVTDLSNGLADPIRVTQAYSEILDLLADRQFWFEAQLVSVVAGTGSYTLPDGFIYPSAVLYDDRELMAETRQGLEAYNANWRDLQSDTPFCYFLEDELDRNFRLVPQPTQNSKNWVPVFGSPLGLDYAPYSACVIATLQRDPFQWWLNLHAALMICHLEFIREGPQQDVDFAAACHTLAMLLMDKMAAHGQ